MELLGVLVLDPVGFRGESIVVPSLLGREVVTLAHPLRLEPENVAGNINLSEHGGIVEDVELLLAHVGAEAESVGPFWKHVGASGHVGVGVEDCGHVISSHQEEVGLVVGIDDVEQVLLDAAHVKETLAGRVVIYSPSPGAHHEGHRDLSVLVGRPHP